MKTCVLTIVSTVDGKENTFSYSAEIEFLEGFVCLRYEEEGGETQLRLREGEASIVRKGAYGLSLILKEGERGKGLLTVAGSTGEIEVLANRIGYSIGKNSLLAIVKYSMFFEKEIQEMSLRIKASYDNSEEK